MHFKKQVGVLTNRAMWSLRGFSATLCQSFKARA